MSNGGWVGTWRPHRPRGPVMAQFSSPGPKYYIQGATGYISHIPTKRKAPAYSMHGSRPPLSKECSPVLGPHVVATTASPSYSIAGKNKGGCFDDLHKVSLVKSCAPVVTFGIKHSDYTTPVIVDVY
uniref:Ciliary microtubule associated protein 1A n=1 Tax=Salvator merianae TaxID=96440 RepID=A0A8D0C3M5_SALMN